MPSGIGSPLPAASTAAAFVKLTTPILGPCLSTARSTCRDSHVVLPVPNPAGQ